MLYATFSTYDFASQGMGALKYAREAAQMSADHATANSVKTEMRAKQSGKDNCYFEVWVCLTKKGAKILKDLPGLTIRDWLKACWKRGVNPRVYNPFIPTGIEEELGIDYFGNDNNASK